jgi:hypothetical protein
VALSATTYDSFFISYLQGSLFYCKIKTIIT